MPAWASRTEVLSALLKSSHEGARQAKTFARALQDRVDVPERVKHHARLMADGADTAASNVGRLPRDLGGDSPAASAFVQGGNVGAALDAIYYAGVVAGLHSVYKRD